MQESEVVLSVLRERGRKGLPLTQLYRQMFNKELYLLAYGNIYSNKGAMTPGASEETCGARLFEFALTCGLGGVPWSVSGGDLVFVGEATEDGFSA